MDTSTPKDGRRQTSNDTNTVQSPRSRTEGGSLWVGRSQAGKEKKACYAFGLLAVEPDCVEGFLPAANKQRRRRAAGKLEPFPPLSPSCSETTSSPLGATLTPQIDDYEKRQGRVEFEQKAGFAESLGQADVTERDNQNPPVASQQRGVCPGIFPAPPRKCSEHAGVQLELPISWPRGSPQQSGFSVISSHRKRHATERARRAGERVNRSRAFKDDPVDSRLKSNNRCNGERSDSDTPTSAFTRFRILHQSAGWIGAQELKEDVGAAGNATGRFLGMRKLEVQQMARSGEATAGYAAAQAIVMCTKSFRFGVSRHLKGRPLFTKVWLPWRPPPDPPILASGIPQDLANTRDDHTLGSRNRGTSRNQADANGRLVFSRYVRFAGTNELSVDVETRGNHDWERRRAAMEVQRCWRGYTTRREFWTEGGAGLHALAVRVQRIYRGWRGKVAAVNALTAKRAAAAAAISALGRGFQGRREARQLRVNRHNRAAASIQHLWRGRIARRWFERIAGYAAVRRAIVIQAGWRGFVTRRRFRSLGLLRVEEENAIEEICKAHERREKPRGPLPILPVGFEDRYHLGGCNGSGSPGIFEGIFGDVLPPAGSLTASRHSPLLPSGDNASNTAVFSSRPIQPSMASLSRSDRESRGTINLKTVSSSAIVGTDPSRESSRDKVEPPGHPSSPVHVLDIHGRAEFAAQRTDQFARAPPAQTKVSTSISKLDNSNQAKFDADSTHRISFLTGCTASDISKNQAEFDPSCQCKMSFLTGCTLSDTKEKNHGGISKSPSSDRTGSSAALSAPRPKSTTPGDFRHGEDVESSDGAQPLRFNPAQEEALFFACGHCLLAGCGFTASLKTAAKFNFCGGKALPPGVRVKGEAGGRWRRKLYGDALDVFHEGVRRFPGSTRLLYGAAMTMQIAWFTNGRGATPIPYMLETAILLLERAWANDPDRQMYLQAEEFFVAAARSAKKRYRAACVAFSAIQDSAAHQNDGPKEKGVLMEASVCGRELARAVLHLAVWSQIAHGNFEMDLASRKETVPAYRRASRLYVRAMRLDSDFELSEIPACETFFSAFFNSKKILLQMKPIRLSVPPHYYPSTLEAPSTSLSALEFRGSHRHQQHERQESLHRDRKTPGAITKPVPNATLVLRRQASRDEPDILLKDNDPTVDVERSAGSSTKLLSSDGLVPTQKRIQSRLVEVPSAVAVDDTSGTTASASSSITAVSPRIRKDFEKVQVVVRAWRAEKKLLLRVENKRANGAGRRLVEHGVSEPSPAADNVDRGSGLFWYGVCVVIIHEDEVQNLHAMAVEAQVLEGRPREILESQDHFRLVVDYFIGKVVLLPVLEGDSREKYSKFDSAAFRNGRYVAIIPALEEMRQETAEESARDDAARLLQRLFKGLVVRQECRNICHALMEAIRVQREHGRLLLQEDVLQQKEASAAQLLQALWKGWAWRRRLGKLKAATLKVQRCFRRLEERRLAAKAERHRLFGPEVLTVYQQGTVVSGVPLMLSVLRCGFSFKFVGRDQEACWVHQGFCYEFEVMEILRKHNMKMRKGATEGTSRLGAESIEPSQYNKVVAFLVANLALVDALWAPTSELRAQHRYKTLVVDTLSENRTTMYGGVSAAKRLRRQRKEHHAAASDTGSLRGPGILASGAERGRGLRDTRAIVASGYKRYLKRQEKWKEARRKQAYMQHHQQKESKAVETAAS